MEGRRNGETEGVMHSWVAVGSAKWNPKKDHHFVSWLTQRLIESVAHVQLYQ